MKYYEIVLNLSNLNQDSELISYLEQQRNYNIDSDNDDENRNCDFEDYYDFKYKFLED
jgi:hypothetical protein